MGEAEVDREFDLRVRFGRGWSPPHVWTLRDVRQCAGSYPVGHQHPVDRAGEVHLQFCRLLPSLGYGARWEVDDQSITAWRAFPQDGAERNSTWKGSLQVR